MRKEGYCPSGTGIQFWSWDCISVGAQTQFLLIVSGGIIASNDDHYLAIETAAPPHLLLLKHLLTQELITRWLSGQSSKRPGRTDRIKARIAPCAIETATASPRHVVLVLLQIRVVWEL